MAVTYRFPLMVWKDHEGWYTASLLEWDEPAGVGRRYADAVEQVQEYLAWRYEQSWLATPDFLDPQLLAVKVPVRPEYRESGRRFPCDESVVLRVWCATGRQEHGLFVCVMPTLNLRFYYYEEASFRPLVTHYVQQHLEGITPQGLARHLPPAEAALDHAIVTLNRRESRRAEWEPELGTLKQVAEPVGDPRFRKLMARPWQRDREVNDLVRRLGRERANVLLVGEPGSGKTTVLVEAVRLLERQASEEDEEARRGLAARRYWLTSCARIISGMKYLGQWEERCEALISELAALGGTLCVDNLLDLLREGGEGPADSIAAFFLPYLQRGELRLVGEATAAELDACRRLLPGFADVFQVLRMEPFGRAEAVSVLDHLADLLRQNHPIEIGRSVTDLVYHLHRRFLPYHAFPGRAAAFLGRVIELARQEPRPSRDAVVEVDAERVVREFVRQTGLPELFLRDEQTLGREEVEAAFRRQIIGQDEAVRAAAGLVLAFKAGMNDPNRPVGVLLFCGPTGVGKTEMAKALARFFFGHGDGERLVRLDMSEYTGPGAAERLLSQPDGQPSELIQKLRQQPFVVLLLDEIEKADLAVFDVLLGVFDEGRLTDPFGRLTTFRSAIIVMTSNLGAGKQESFGFGPRGAVPYEGEALAFFRPEFFNRLDGVVTFQPLAPETIQVITRKELAEITSREGIARLNLRLEWSERLVEHLAREGFDARYGARPLQRTLETLVVTPLARHLLANPGLHDATLLVDLGPAGIEVVRA
jgi:ATP-dependent Clp protease ATP-binding subunit ClpC